MEGDKVTGGVGSEALGLLKKAFDVIFRGLDKFLISDGYTPKNTKDIEEDGKVGKQIQYEVGSEGTIVLVKLFPVQGKDNLFEIEITSKGCKKVIKSGIKKEDIMKHVVDYADKNELGSVEGEIDASRKLQVSLKRVCGSKEDAIHLTAICANYPISEALSDLDDIFFNSQEFVDAIPEDATSFEIKTIDDEYDVELIDSVDTSSCYYQMFEAAASFLNNVYAIHWGSKGRNFEEIHRYTDEYLWTIRSQVDILAELVVEKENSIPHLSNITSEKIDTSCGFDLDSGMSILKSLTDKYVNVLEKCYVNFDTDVQSMLDDWIRGLKKKSDYFINRRLMN